MGSTRMKGFVLLKCYKDYRDFWISNFISYIAVWIQVVGAGILMSQYTNSSVMISLVQVASSFPIFLFAIPFAVIADLVNIYTLLALTQAIMACASFLFSYVVLHTIHMPEAILIFTLIIGIATAIRLPIGQSAISQTIPHQEIKIAAIMNNLGFSIARSAGPFMAGIMLFYFSPTVVFLWVGILFGISSYFFFKKSRNNKKQVRVKTRFLDEFWKGMRYLTSNRYLLFICVYSFVFFFFTTSVWAALPYVAQHVLDVSVKMQGAMTGVIGLGSILTGFIFPSIRTSLSNNKILFFIFILSGVSLFSYLIMPLHFALMFLSLLSFGFSWAAAVAYFNGELQSNTPAEIRSRIISIYFFIMYGGIALGNLVTGQLLSVLSANVMFMIFGGCLIACGVVFKIMGLRV